MKRIWPIFWVLLALFLIVRTGVRDRGVITDHIETGRRLLAAEELYAEFDKSPLNAPYPPGFGLLWAPFTLLPERVARFAWGILQVIALWVIALWLRQMLGAVAAALRRRLHLLLLLTMVLALRFILRDTHGGGTNLVNIGMTLAALLLARRGHGTAAGILLGFSLATKPTQLLIVGLLWLFGHRRAAIASVLAAISFTALALLINQHGLSPLATWLQGSWAYTRQEDLFATPSHGFPPFTWMNQCLRCSVARWLGEVPTEYATQVPYFTQGFGLGHQTTALLARALGLGLVAVTAWVAWRQRSQSAAQPAIYAAALSLSLLLSPVSWKAHHVALIPALFLLLCHGIRGSLWVWVFIAAYVPLCLAGEEILILFAGDAESGKSFKQLQQSLYLVTAGTLSLWAFCLSRGGRRTESVLAPDARGR